MSSRYLQWSPSNFSFYSFSLLTIWCRLCLVGIGVHFVYSIWFVQLWMFCNLCFCIECSYCSSHRTQQLTSAIWPITFLSLKSQNVIWVNVIIIYLCFELNTSILSQSYVIMLSVFQDFSLACKCCDFESFLFLIFYGVCWN